MFARIVTFAGGDQTRVDEVIATVRDRIDANIPELQDALGFWMLVDRKRAQMLGISLFDDREALRRGDKALERLGHPAPEAGGELRSVDVYEGPVRYENPRPHERPAERP